MWPVQWAKLAFGGRNQIIHVKVTENAVVRFACMFIGEKAEKQKYITNANTLILEVRLSRTALAEQALATSEHRILMA